MEITDSKFSQSAEDENQGGFNFDLYNRNVSIFKALKDNNNEKSSVLPSAWKTGTTIVGILYKDGVVLGADTRATGGSEVVDKNCEKIHYIAPNIWCCGAGNKSSKKQFQLNNLGINVLLYTT